MKIVRNTPDQLILRSVPWVTALIMSAGIVASVGFGLRGLASGNGGEAFWGIVGLPAFLTIFLLAFVRRDDLILDRSRDLVELRHASFFGRRKIKHRLHDLERAMVQTSQGDDGDTYRVALVLSSGMDAGIHPVTEVYSSGTGADHAVSAINQWLQPGDRL